MILFQYITVLNFLIATALFLVTVTPVSATGSCDDLRVVSGNNRFVPSTVTFHARATDPDGPIQGFRFYFGDGSQQDSINPDITHTFSVSGMYTARVDIKDANGVWSSSPSCQIIFSLLESPLESQKSGCSNVFIEGPDTVPAGTNVKFLVTGYDNKSGIKEFKIDYGNSQMGQNNIGNFNLTFSSPGTFTVKGSVQDSKNNWVTADSCRNTLYVTGAPITVQPATGTPTVVTAAGLLAGFVLIILYGKTTHHHRRS